MPLWLVVLVVGLLVIGTLAVLAPTGLNDWFNAHRWVLPALSFLAVAVIVILVGGFSSELRHDQIVACESGNPEKVGDVENLEHDRALYRSLRTEAREAGKPNAVAAYTLAIEQKSEAIGSRVSARTEFTEHPGAKPTLAVIKDCAAAYSSGATP